ncbi:uncharacterized protein LOC115363518 isoform X1 [Myripristis murdjan]|uniref:uncharacterized protein LOC115363518 isoform X1 n=1 Tax=Myripristis murdjan TaxID=586833 RepID=UPI00117625F8|nr:uncharacterized protein LOC115363518 isoform X1 [Myripristis murdjan]
MEIADQLITEIYSCLDQLIYCAQRLEELASELEDIRKTATTSDDVGGSFSLLSAGTPTALTGGVKVPLLAGLGAATSLGSDTGKYINSSSTCRKATDAVEKLNEHEAKIRSHLNLLESRGQSEEKAVEEYVLDSIVKALAKRSGLKWNDNFKSLPKVTELTKKLANPESDIWWWSGLQTGVGVLVPEGALGSLVADGDLSVVVKAAGKIGARAAAGLELSVTELKSVELAQKDSGKEASENLRDEAKRLTDRFIMIRCELDEICGLFKELAGIQCCIENPDINSPGWMDLINFTIQNCEDESLRKLLWENSMSQELFKLFSYFKFLTKDINGVDRNEDIHIIIVAHGSITPEMMPTSRLTPLFTIEDVLLYSPWNCMICPEAAYGIATGLIEIQDRSFYCYKDECPIPSPDHQPTKLPDDWNSMRASSMQVPDIKLSPLGPRDGAWGQYLVLEGHHGHPRRNRIVIPYRVPLTLSFSIVNLVLSIVLLFFERRAKVHLAACLGKRSPDETFDEDGLRDQYSYTNDNTAMNAPMELNPYPALYEALKAVFGPR